MDWIDLGTIISAFLGSLGGGGVIVKILADRYLETMKVELRKSEFLFQKEFEAASQFIALSYRLRPRSPHSEETPIDPYEDFTERFGRVQKEFEQYREAHAAALPREMLDRLDAVIDKARDGTVAVELERQQPSPDGRPSDYALKLAGEVAGELKEMQDDLWQAIRWAASWRCTSLPPMSRIGSGSRRWQPKSKPQLVRRFRWPLAIKAIRARSPLGMPPRRGSRHLDPTKSFEVGSANRKGSSHVQRRDRHQN